INRVWCFGCLNDDLTDRVFTHPRTAHPNRHPRLDRGSIGRRLEVALRFLKLAAFAVADLGT
ncbi:MAG: hypothetical protein KKG73_13290, partial [Gammaproteobacteria bacterium]|nr:hypothetical protein [Gammaproteobacteria bacterium]